MCLQAIQGDTVKAQKSQSKYTAVQEFYVVLFYSTNKNICHPLRSLTLNSSIILRMPLPRAPIMRA